MKGFLFTLVLGGAVLFAMVWYGAEPLAGALVQASLPSGLQSPGTQVSVDADPPTDLLGLHADQVSVSVADPRLGDLSGELLVLDLFDVHLGDRTAREVRGLVTGGVVDTDQGPLDIPTIQLEGDLTAIRAVASVDSASAEALILAEVTSATGKTPTAVRIEAPDGLTVQLRGVDIPGALDVEAGALRLELAGPLPITVTLLEPGATPLELRTVRVAGDRLVLEGGVDPAHLGV